MFLIRYFMRRWGLSSDLRQIQCASHDARFDIKTGRCLAGPCFGKSLQSLELSIRNRRLNIVLN